MKERLLNASKNKELNRGVPKYITLEEIEKAEREILRHVQRRAFPEEFNHPEKPLKKSSRLYKLDPIVINGLLHVDGRLRKASLPMESKHQIILPKEDHVTRVTIDDYRRACGHSGREHVLASVRQKFWITQGSSTVRSVLERCVSCRRRHFANRRWPTYRKVACWPRSHPLHQWAWITSHSKSVVGGAS